MIWLSTRTGRVKLCLAVFVVVAIVILSDIVPCFILVLFSDWARK